MPRLSPRFAALLLLSALLPLRASAVQLALAAGATDCFVETVSPNNKLVGSFEVLSSPQLGLSAAAAAAAARVARVAEAVRRGGGIPPAPPGAAVEVTVTDAADAPHYASARERAGSFTVLAPAAGAAGETAAAGASSTFRICFSNLGPEPQLVAFALHSGDELYRGIATKAHVTPLEQEVTELADAIAAVEDEARFAYSRGTAARALDERTNSGVAVWSALELLTMVMVGLLQIWATGSFFERRQRY